jgi:hypothetical protein
MFMEDHARERIELADPGLAFEHGPGVAIAGVPALHDVGSAVLGQLFDRFGWTACVAGVGAALAIAALLTARLALRPAAAASPA